MTKILTAKDIMAQKGIERPQFATNDFMQEVAQYFLTHDPNSRLLLFPYRFASVRIPSEDDPLSIVPVDELKNLPPDERQALFQLEKPYAWWLNTSHEDLSKHDYSEEYFEDKFLDNPFALSWLDRLRSYKNETLTDQSGNLIYIEQLNSMAIVVDRCLKFVRDQEKYSLLRPRFLVDHAFAKNIAATLRIMGGYIVEPFRRGGVTYYNVTLT